MQYFLLNPNKLNPIEDYSEDRVNWLLKKIKSEYEWRVPISVAIEHNLIMDGHHRLESSIRLGLKRVPCFIFSYKDIKTYSLRQGIKVSSEDIIQNFRLSKIYPYKTAKHELPSFAFNPINLKELKL